MVYRRHYKAWESGSRRVQDSSIPSTYRVQECGDGNASGYRV